MTIRDKVTPELKRRFREEIKKTTLTNKERGFLICSDEEGKLSATSASCEGEECEISGLQLLAFQCPYKIQGDFHTHAGIDKAKKLFETKYNRKISTEEAKKIISDTAKKIGINVTSPSHGDLLNTLIKKYKDIDMGTACIGTDIDPNVVECWSIKNDVEKKDYIRASVEVNTSLTNDILQYWIKPFFDTEIIELNNNQKNKTQK